MNLYVRITFGVPQQQCAKTRTTQSYAQLISAPIKPTALDGRHQIRLLIQGKVSRGRGGRKIPLPKEAMHAASQPNLR